MPFQEMERRIEAKPDQAACTVRLKLKKNGKTVLWITIREKLVRGLRWGSDVEGVRLSIGTGEDAGKMLLLGCKKNDPKMVGIIRNLKGSMVIDCGHVPELGLLGRAITPAAIGLHAQGALGKEVLITLPNPWPEDVAEAEGDDEDDHPVETDKVIPKIKLQAPLGPTTQSLPKPIVQKPATLDPALIKTANAIRSGDHELTFDPPRINGPKGSRVILTANEVECLAPLISNIEKMMDNTSLQKIAFPGIPAESASLRLDGTMLSLIHKIKDNPALGLKLTKVPKMGYTLARA